MITLFFPAQWGTESELKWMDDHDWLPSVVWVPGQPYNGHQVILQGALREVRQ